MTRKIRSIRVSPALVVSCVALFMALTGSALAVGIAKNSVRSAQIVDGTIRAVDLHDGAVTAPKLAENAVSSANVAPDSLTAEDLAPNSVGSSEIAENAVTSAKIAPHAVGAGQLGTVTVRTNSTTVAKGANGSVSVSCAPGEQVLGGGAQPGHFGTEMTSSRPSGNGWLYQAVNNTSGEDTLSVFALCLAG